MPVLNLTSISTIEAVIINKKELDGEQIILTISKTLQHLDLNNYTNKCTAEMYMEEEEKLDILNRTFTVKVCVQGTFENDSSEDLGEDFLHTETFRQLIPHLRANMASLMATSGMTPYMIPNSILSEFA